MLTADEIADLFSSTTNMDVVPSENDTVFDIVIPDAPRESGEIIPESFSIVNYLINSCNDNGAFEDSILAVDRSRRLLLDCTHEAGLYRDEESDAYLTGKIYAFDNDDDLNAKLTTLHDGMNRDFFLDNLSNMKVVIAQYPDLFAEIFKEVMFPETVEACLQKLSLPK